MSDNNACACAGAPKLIFACSGAADTGAISDLAARKLTAQGDGRMYCLAGIGGRVSGIMATTSEAAKILAIDGCPLDCVKNSLLQAGFETFEHLRVTDHGMTKGQSPATDERVTAIAKLGAAALACE